MSPRNRNPDGVDPKEYGAKFSQALDDIERQEFIDTAAIAIAAAMEARGPGAITQCDYAAAQAYTFAEVLWAERARRMEKK